MIYSLVHEVTGVWFFLDPVVHEEDVVAILCVENLFLLVCLSLGFSDEEVGHHA